ncbi:DUF4136 domain-containing protein [Maridesulfovibrio bastinii]|uniref:DUF4136 domain-containing protein n=1 Tax=Maridesulfovibrio bastinii TaxID=47157 RepID=UPI0004048EFF|nr:DUF4136 domain-containing protein [Maridesulfovibrio bastinii]
MRKFLLLVVMAGLVLSGCVYVDMEVRNQPVSTQGIQTMKRFNMADSGQDSGELGKKLYAQAKSELEQKGYIYDEKSPEFSVMVRYGSKSFTARGVSYDRVGWGYNYIDKEYVDDSLKREGNSETNINQVKIYMISPGSENNPVFLWRSSASSSDREGVAVVGPCLLKGALSHFPGQPGKFSEKVNLRSCNK